MGYKQLNRNIVCLRFGSRACVGSIVSMIHRHISTKFDTKKIQTHHLIFLVLDCRFNCHKKCAASVPKDCQGEVFYIPGLVGFESVDYESDNVSELESVYSSVSSPQDDWEEESADHVAKSPLR